MAMTWILVADRAKARVLSFDPADAEVPLEERLDVVNPEGRLAGRELEGARAPSTHDRMGHGRHAIEPHTTLEDKVAQRFAARLADTLERGRVEHRYVALVLVAPPRFLGQLRSTLDPQVLRHVAAQIDKDLCAATPAEIVAALPRLN